MSDFIREVDEEYRRDRAAKLFSRFQVPLAVLAVAIVAGAGGWRWWADAKVTAAQRENVRFVAAQELAKSGKDADAQAAFAAIAKDGPPGYALLARMRGAEALAPRDPEAAAKAFDDIASDETLAVSMRDTARFRGALLRTDTDPKAFEQRYGRFALPGFAYHSSMRELLALMALKRGDGDAAGRYLDEIIVDPGAPTAMRNRAEAFRTLVTAGPAEATKTQAPPASVKPVADAGAPAPASAPPPAAAPAPMPTPAPTPAPPTAATEVPVAPAPAPPGAKPTAPVIPPPPPTDPTKPPAANAAPE